MNLILPASSSPDLKAFPLCSKSSKSSDGGQVLPAFFRVVSSRYHVRSQPGAAKTGETVCFVPLRFAPLHKPHRLAVARISPVASYCLVTLSTRGGKTLISRLNLLPPPPAAPGRACLLCHLCPASASAHADAKPAHKYHRPKRIRTLRRVPSLTLISSPMVVPGFIHI